MSPARKSLMKIYPHKFLLCQEALVQKSTAYEQ